VCPIFQGLHSSFTMSSSAVDSHIQLYNTLPSVNDAHNILSSNTHIIQQLWPLLREYEGKFGLCLVHRHCTLQDKERMVTDGLVTEPLITNKCHPIRWLKSGEPFEFSLGKTEYPPDRLFQDFRLIVGDLTIFGIFYIPEEERTTLRFGFEHTRGRKNIMRSIDVVITAWCFMGDKQGPATACNCCTNPTHGRKKKFTESPSPVTLPYVSSPTSTSDQQELDCVYLRHLSPSIFNLTAGTLTAMRSCASLLPRVCVQVAQLEMSYDKWDETKLDDTLTTVFIKDTTEIIRSLAELSENVDDLGILICSLSSTLKDFQSRGLRMRQTEEIAAITQFRILQAQFVCLTSQVSALGEQLDRVPNVDPCATGLREWSSLFATVSSETQVLDEKVDSVSGILSELVIYMTKNKGLSHRQLIAD
jgi:hypothetical protein